MSAKLPSVMVPLPMGLRYFAPDYPLGSSYLRHSRSRECLSELYRLVAIFQDERAQSVVAYQDRNSGELRPLQEIEKRVPLDLALEASEMIYNLRVALDYAFYALAKQAVARRRLSKRDFVKMERSLYFPIICGPNAFATWRAGPKGKWLTKRVCAVIEGAQPYNRPFMHLLGRLYHNLDKHRDLQPFVPKYDFSSGQLHEIPWLDESGKVHTEPNPALTPMGMYRGASVEVTFDDGSPVVETLELLQSEVGALIDTLSLAFY